MNKQHNDINDSIIFCWIVKSAAISWLLCFLGYTVFLYWYVYLNSFSCSGKKIVIIAHDFPPESDDIRRIRMTAFRTQQPTVFKYADLAMICGRLDDQVEMMEEDWQTLKEYLGCTRRLDALQDKSVLGEKLKRTFIWLKLIEVI